MDVFNLHNSALISLTGAALSAYLCDSIPLIEKARLQAGNKSHVISFMKAPTSPPKQNLRLREILHTVGYDVKEVDVVRSHGNERNCTHCGDILITVGIEGETVSCGKCFARQPSLDTSTPVRDDICTPEGDTDRLARFKLVVNQYCGKQTVNIDEGTLEKIRSSLRLYRLMDNNDAVTTLTKIHIARVLKELSLTRYNENIHWLYSRLTGRPPCDISRIEDKLYEDFRYVSETFDRLYVDNKRKNFINLQFILYQLLVRNGIKCSRDEFTLTSTFDTQLKHDRELQIIFNELGWIYTSI